MVYCYFVGPVAALHPAFSIILVKHSYPDICSPVMASTFYNLNKDKVCQHITHYTHYTLHTRQWTWTNQYVSHIPRNSGVTDLMPTNISVSCHLLWCYEQHINILPPKYGQKHKKIWHSQYFLFIVIESVAKTILRNKSCYFAALLYLFFKLNLRN